MGLAPPFCLGKWSDSNSKTSHVLERMLGDRTGKPPEHQDLRTSNERALQKLIGAIEGKVIKSKDAKAWFRALMDAEQMSKWLRQETNSNERILIGASDSILAQEEKKSKKKQTSESKHI